MPFAQVRPDFAYRLLSGDGAAEHADEPDLPLNALSQAEAARIKTEIARLEADLPAQFPPEGGQADREQVFRQAFHHWCDRQQEHLARWTVSRPTKYETNLPRLQRLSDDSLFASGDFTKRDEFKIRLELPAEQRITAIRLEALPDARLPAGGPGRAYYEGRKGDFFLSEIEVKVDGQTIEFSSGSRSYGKIAVGVGTRKPPMCLMATDQLVGQPRRKKASDIRLF